jgi:alpha-tubulin suppressor-like RCC1 family protein
MGRARLVAVAFISACLLAAIGSSSASAATGAWSWGRNISGQLGTGDEDWHDIPTALSGLEDVTSVSGGDTSGIALLSDGTVEAWGENTFGQLGNGTQERSLSPIPVPGLSNVVAISMRYRTALAVLSNGKVMAWGEGSFGQMGNGHFKENNLVPVEVSGLSKVVAISAGYTHCLALLENGEVMAWGGDRWGQLGDGREGSVSNTDVPVAVKELMGVTALSAGNTHSLALTSSGQVWAWGDNLRGELGIGTKNVGSSVPEPVVGLPEAATSVSAGNEFSLAALEGGAAMAWGLGEDGQLGNGEEGATETPVAVQGITNASAVSAGFASGLALLRNGTVDDWGDNQHGELGAGLTRPFDDVPVQVCGVHEATGISAAVYANFAFGPSEQVCPIVTSVSPKEGPSSGGTTVTITGRELSGATAINFGPASTTEFTVNSPTSITAVAPPHAGGIGGEAAVTVTTPVATSMAKFKEANFIYVARPTVTGVKPASGPATGGKVVKIFGNGLAKVTRVMFGPNEAPSFKLEFTGGAHISAVTPPGLAGKVHVTITSTGGTSEATGADLFKYTPVITSVTPSSGTVTGGTPVTVVGVGLAVGTSDVFKFGIAKAKGVNCASSTECTMTTPAHAAGTVEVKVTANNVPSAKNPAAKFTYE